MRTGELASKAGISVATVRFYEKRGLLPRARRLENGYRDFPDTAADQLRLLLACRELGISLAAVHGILGKVQNKKESCAGLSQLIERELEQLRMRMRDLRRVETELERLKNSCGPSRRIEHCGILRELELSSRELPR